MISNKSLCAAVALIVAAFAVGSARAQDYPQKPVRIVVGFAAGSVSDLVARAVGQKLSAAFGQQFVVEVRPGAGSNVAAQYVARSPKDGYTLFVTTSSSTIRNATPAKLGFDFGSDFAPITMMAEVPFVLTAYPGLGVKTVKEFIALAKAKPKELTFGGTVVGTTGYLAAQLFNQRAGTDLPIAPYPSTVQATTDLMTGRISIAFASASNVLQLIEEGKLVALAIATPKRSRMMPSVPSIDEAGLPGVYATLWIGILAPAGTPPQIVNAVSKAINEILKSDDITKQLQLQGMEALGGSPEEFAARIKSDTAQWDAVMEATQPGK